MPEKKRFSSTIIEDLAQKCVVRPGSKVKISDLDTNPEGKSDVDREESKEIAKKILKRGIEKLAEEQERLYASDSWALLVIFQAMDAAGKDSTIKHVLSGINPQGCQVYSFKHPSAEELDHNFLWRYTRAMPERGRIGIFNRSYYEDVLIVRVHPELVVGQKIPGVKAGKQLWQDRFEDINALERHLSRNGTKIVKFFLNVSLKEQKKRLLDRMDDPSKHWKFASSDMTARERWGDYMQAYEAAMTATSTPWAPWHIVPADNKWVMRAVVASILSRTLHDLKLKFPEISEEQRRDIKHSRKILMG